MALTSGNYRTKGSSYNIYEGDDSVNVCSLPRPQEGGVYYSDEECVENVDRSSYDRRPDPPHDYHRHQDYHRHHDYHHPHDYKHHHAMSRRRPYDSEDPIADSQYSYNEYNDHGASSHTSRSDLLHISNDQDVSQNTSQQYIPPLMNAGHEHAHNNQESSLHTDRDSLWLDREQTSSETGGSYDRALNHESHFWSKRNETGSRYLPHVAPPSLMSLNCTRETLQDPVMSSSRYDEKFGHPTQVKVEESNSAERIQPEPLMSLPMSLYGNDNLQNPINGPSSSEHYPSSSYNLEERSANSHGFEFSRLGRETPYTSADESDYFSTRMREPNLHRANNPFSDLRCTPIEPLDYRRGNSEVGTYPARLDVLSRLGPENLPIASVPKQLHVHEDLRLSLRRSNDSAITITDQIDLRMSVPLPHLENESVPSKIETDFVRTNFACPTDTGMCGSSSRQSSSVNIPPNAKDFAVERKPSSFDLPFSKIDGSMTHVLPLQYSYLQKPYLQKPSVTYPKSSSKRKPKCLISKNSPQHGVARTKRSTKRPKNRSRSSGSHERCNKTASYSKLSKKTPIVDKQKNIRRLSKSVIGNLTEHLDVSSDSKDCLLSRLYNACAVVIEILAKEKKNEMKFLTVLQTLCNHFSGFFCATLVSTHPLPASIEDLFINELNHLRTTCGNNVAKWRMEINKFVNLAGPNLATDVTVLDESPKSLMIDVSTADFVGYRPPKSEPNMGAAQASEKSSNGNEQFDILSKRLDTVELSNSCAQPHSVTTSTVEITKPTNVISTVVPGHAVDTCVETKFLSPQKGSSGDFPAVISMLKPASAKESRGNSANTVNGTDPIGPVETQSCNKLARQPCTSTEEITCIQQSSKTPTSLDKTDPNNFQRPSVTSVTSIKGNPIENFLELPANPIELSKCHSETPEEEELFIQKSNSQDKEAVYLCSVPPEVCSPEDDTAIQSHSHPSSLQEGPITEVCSPEDDTAIQSHSHPSSLQEGPIAQCSVKDVMHPANSLKDACAKEREPQKKDYQTSTTREKRSQALSVCSLETRQMPSFPESQANRKLSSIKDQEYHDLSNDKAVLVTSNIPVGSLERTDKGLKSLLEIVMCGGSTKQDSTTVAPPFDNSQSLPSSQKLCLVSSNTSPESHLVGSSPRTKNVFSKPLERGSLSPGEIVSTSPSPSPPPPLPEQNNGSRKLVKSDPHNKIRNSLTGIERSNRMRTSSEKNRYKRRPYVQQSSRRKVSRSNVGVVSKSGKKSYIRNPLEKIINSESDDELELLDLRKKALMSMIQDKKSSAPVSVRGYVTACSDMPLPYYYPFHTTTVQWYQCQLEK